MDSKMVKAAYKAHGLTVRVRDLGHKFRICGVTKSAVGELVEMAAASLGLIAITGELGGSWNGSTEFIAYRPEAVRHV